MIKKIFLFLSSALIYTTAYCQDQLMIDSFSSKNFSGIVHSQNPQSIVYCTVTEKEKTFLKIVTFNASFSKPTITRYPVSKTTLVFGAVALDRGSLLILGDPATKKRTVLMMDQMGKVISEKSEDVSTELLSKSAPYYTFKGMPQGAIVLMPANGKAAAYKMVKYNDEMAIAWTKDLKVDKGNLAISDAQCDLEKIIIFCKESKDGKSVYSLKTLNSDRGDIMMDYQLKEDEQNMFPLFAKPNLGMNIAAGTLYKDGKYDESKQADLCAMISGPDGKTLKSAKISYEKLQKFLPQAKINSINNGARLAVVEATVTELNTFEFICELFDKKSDIVRISDIAVLKLDEQGEIASLKYIPGLNDYVAKIPAEIAAMNTQDAMEWFYKNRFFHTKFLLPMGRNNYIGYTDVDSGTIRAYVVSTDSLTRSSIKELPTITPPRSADMEKINGEYVFNASAAAGELYKWQYFDCIKLVPEFRIQTYTLNPPQLLIKNMPAELMR